MCVECPYATRTIACAHLYIHRLTTPLHPPTSIPPPLGLPPGVPSRNPKHVGRLAVLTLTTPTPHDTITTLHTLKHLARTHRCAVLVTVPTGVYGGDCDVLLHHVADVVLQLQPLMDDHPLLQLIADPQTYVLCC